MPPAQGIISAKLCLKAVLAVVLLPLFSKINGYP